MSLVLVYLKSHNSKSTFVSDVIQIPHYSLSPTCLTLYETLEGHHISDRQRNTWSNLEDNENKFAELSAHSVKRLRRSINFMIYTTQEKQITGKQIITKSQNFTTEYEKGTRHQKPVSHKLSMITLTLPAKQMHDDETIKSKCLNQFLIEIRTKFKCSDYIWKAEKQENSNLHFHILINRYIHHEKIKTIWNRIINKIGYVDKYSENQKKYFSHGFKLSDNPKDRRSEAQQRQAYEAGKLAGWNNPNSTDIHALYKVKNAGAYLTKYLAKGVTKTERTEQIKAIRKTLLQLETLKINIDKSILFDKLKTKEREQLEEQFKNLENQILSQNEKLSELLKTGVSGRIWGQSQSLSKLKPFTEVQNWDNIPEIQEVEQHKEHKIIHTIGDRKIFVYIIQIKKFPKLNTILQNHLSIKPVNPLLFSTS